MIRLTPGEIRLTREQARRIDQQAQERYRIPGIVLMENAAIAAAHVACDMCEPGDGPVHFYCGGGNNGGDGLAIARQLHNADYDLRILFTADPEKYTGEARVNYDIGRAMNLPMDDWKKADGRPALIVDAIFGTGLSKPPRPPFADIVMQIASTRAPVLAIDIPSGLDCDTGKPLGNACIKASRTITFVGKKVGFDEPAAKPYLGAVVVGDIGCPVELVRQVAP